MAKILIKPGVAFDVIAPGGMRILEVLKDMTELFPQLKYDIVITSGSDGTHSGPDDPHKKGNAYDIRCNTLTAKDKQLLLGFIQEALGQRFFAFIEAPGTANEHIHCQVTKGTFYDMPSYLNNS